MSIEKTFEKACALEALFNRLSCKVAVAENKDRDLENELYATADALFEAERQLLDCMYSNQKEILNSFEGIGKAHGGKDEFAVA